MSSAKTTSSKREAAKEVINILQDIAALLNTRLNRQQLSLCVSLVENGVNPEALAKVINDLRNVDEFASASEGEQEEEEEEEASS